ncbi:MAG: hypothetical protein IKI82_04455 [Lachnospiraceae bacterium]|nr:hypothetical protein [Lachnospiraceae bacterium]
MKILLFALKKTVRTPVYWIFLAAVLLLPPFFYSLGRQTKTPPAGCYLESADDAEAAQVAAYLEESGFLPYASREELRADVENGTLDAGVEIPADLSERLKQGRFEECLTFVVSPTSSFPDLWKEHAVSALFAVCAPYISAAILEEAGIPQEKMFEAYWTRMDAGKLFTFRLSTRDGALVVSEDRSHRFFLFALSLLLFLSSWFCTAAPLAESVLGLAPRIGRGKAFTSLYLPGLLVRLAGLFAAAAAACLIAGEGKLILPAGAYLLLLQLFSLLLAMLPGESWKHTLIFFLAIFSLALCPVYLDLSLLLPLLKGLRRLAPPFWLWMLAGMG